MHNTESDFHESILMPYNSIDSKINFSQMYHSYDMNHITVIIIINAVANPQLHC